MDFNGFTFGWGAKKGDFGGAEADYSINKLLQMGTNFVCLTATAVQDTFYSTDIKFDFKRSPTDKEITYMINDIHKKGAKVCLKPVVNCADGVWRARIDFPTDMNDGDKYWGKWFDSYNAFVLHYAEIAEDTGCEMLCIGCEMLGTESQDAHWRELIALVRDVYHGEITYNANHGSEQNVHWFDALDYIGTSAYYPVEVKPNDTVENMRLAWRTHTEMFENLSKQFNKRIIFMEIGCRSAAGCAMMPWDFTHIEFPYSGTEQANFYDSCLLEFADKDWFVGAFWWDWSTIIYHTQAEADKDLGFNIYLKEAEKVLKKWYCR